MISKRKLRKRMRDAIHGYVSLRYGLQLEESKSEQVRRAIVAAREKNFVSSKSKCEPMGLMNCH